MKRVVLGITRLIREPQGQDLMEYALLASLIAIAAMIAITTLGNTVNNVFWQAISDAFASA